MFNLFGRRKGKDAGDAGDAGQPPEPAPGWDAIEAAFERLYPGQQPRHWAHDGVRRMHDLRVPPENPLDGVSIYDAGAFWHYVSFGLSDLYGKDSPGDRSGFGYELTFRIGKPAAADGKPQREPPLWPISVMVSVARAQMAGAHFAPGHTIKTGSLDGRADCKLTALLVVEDPGVAEHETAHGKLAFLQLVGVEGATRDRALEIGSEAVVARLRADNAGLVTFT